MTAITTKLESVKIATNDNKGASYLQYNLTGNLLFGNLSLSWLGTTLQFSSIADFTEFYTQVCQPIMDTVNSPSGSGVGFVATTSGTQGTDHLN